MTDSPIAPDSSRPTVRLSAKSRDEVVAHTLVALANGPGGQVMLTASKNGRALNMEALRDQVMTLALQCDPPLITPSPILKQNSDQPTLLIEVPPDLPHVYNYEGRYLIWQNDQTEPLSGATLRSLIFARGETSFEGLAPAEATLNDLNWASVEMYSRSVDGLRHLNPEEALLKRGCLRREGDQLKPTYAGLLLFGLDPQTWLPQAQIAVARYPGLQMSDAFSRADIQGTLPEQARQAEAFILQNLPRTVNLNGFQRDDQPSYPVSAVREAIINAIAHRDYSITGDNIRLLIFANRLECYSPGRLPGHVTVNNIVQERFSRNAAIVQVLFDMGFIERLGYGIDRILQTTAELGLPQPDLNESIAGFNLTLYRRPESNQPEPPAVRQWLELGLNERQIKALQYLTEAGRITNADYQGLCSDVSPETLRRDLANLVEKDLLLRIGEKRATFYILK